MEVLQKILLGSTMIVLNLGIKVWAVLLVIGHYRRRVASEKFSLESVSDLRILSVILLFLFLGHILQFATWAGLFLYLGEFRDFETAFYHSTVNFTSLGYGDIVMSENWRLLGALEAANGVLMFGLTAGLVLSVMSELFRRHSPSGGIFGERERRSGDDE
jgi:hypothetical protein